MITFSLVKTAIPKDLKAVNRIAPQLSPSGGSMTMAAYKTMLRTPGHFLMVARDNGVIVGMAMLIFLHSPLKVRGRIECVVVDAEYRGHGIATALVTRLIALGKKKKLHSISLNSEPTRKEANKLYPELGFEKQVSNTYKIKGIYIQSYPKRITPFAKNG